MRENEGSWESLEESGEVWKSFEKSEDSPLSLSLQSFLLTSPTPLQILPLMPRTKTIKPIQRDYQRFQITIKDDFDTYSYTLKLPDTSPFDIMEAVCKKYKVDCPVGEWIGSGFRNQKVIE